MAPQPLLDTHTSDKLCMNKHTNFTFEPIFSGVIAMKVTKNNYCMTFIVNNTIYFVRSPFFLTTTAIYW